MKWKKENKNVVHQVPEIWLNTNNLYYTVLHQYVKKEVMLLIDPEIYTIRQLVEIIKMIRDMLNLKHEISGFWESNYLGGQENELNAFENASRKNRNPEKLDEIVLSLLNELLELLGLIATK